MKKFTYLNMELITLTIVLVNLIWINIYIYIVFSLIIIIYSTIKKIKLKTFLVSYIVSFVVIISYCFLNTLNKIYLNDIIDNILHFSVRNKLIEIVKNNYSFKFANFINLLLFSYKNPNDLEIYQLSVQMSIVYLIIVSGFHINFYFFIIKKIFLKYKKIAEIFSIIFLFFICYLNEFNLSVLRAYLFVLYSIFFKKKKFNLLNMSIINIFIFVPLVFTKMGFQMSCISVFLINLINKFQIKNKWIKWIIISVLIYFVLLPFNIKINNYVTIFAIFYSLIFTPIISGIYIYIFITTFLLFLAPVNEAVFNFFYNFLKFLSKYNIVIYFTNKNDVFWFFYLLFIFLLLLLFFYFRKEKNV